MNVNEFSTMESNHEMMSHVKIQDSESSKASLDTESRLQSLGFIMDNGKARFILEPCTPVYSNAALTNFSITNPSDTLSFVVLGKDSMDLIQASSIASYVDIERKSLSVDYNSMIASWNPDEIYEKLSELLQENGKLKETLKQNTIAMKQQFNSLVNWQEEIMKIHQSHKKKFAETRELISYLKKENNEFKIRLATGETDAESGFEMLTISDTQSTADKKSISETELHEKVILLTKELSNSKQKCEKLSFDVEKLLSISNLIRSQLKQATSTILEQRINLKKLEMQTSMLKSYDSNHFNQSLNCDISQHDESINKCTNCENCLIKDKEINFLKEQLQRATTPGQFCFKSPANLKKYQQQNTQRLQQYKDKLQELKMCFDEQINYCENIEKCIERFREEIFHIIEVSSNCSQCSRFVQECSISKLSAEQQKMTEEKGNAVVVQNQLLKVLLDCSSILYASETILKEKREEDITQTNAITESVKEETESVEQGIENMSLFAKEKERLKEKEQLLESQKKNLEMEYKKLNEAMELLQQEKISLTKEKSSLDQQRQLYESQYKSVLETTQKEYDAKLNQLISEIGILHQTIEKKELRVKELQAEILQYEEYVTLLKTQLEIYQEDFMQEKKQKEELLAEKVELESSIERRRFSSSCD